MLLCFPPHFHSFSSLFCCILPYFPFTYRWASTNYSAGDVLLFTSLTAHSALPNDSNEVSFSMEES